VATPRKMLLGCSSLSFAALFAAGHLGLQAAEPRDDSPPRTLFRLPSWIEPFGSGRTPVPPERAAGPQEGVRPTAGAEELDRQADRDATRAQTGETASNASDNPVRRWFNDQLSSLTTPGSLFSSKRDKGGTESPTADAATAAPSGTESSDASGPAIASAIDPPAATATISAPVAVTPDEIPALSIDPASFRGVHPGKTTREEVEGQWGPPANAFTTEGGEEALAWSIEPFERVEVVIEAGTVASIRIKLGEPVEIADLAKQLEIADLDSVAVVDDAGEAVGEVYPERGVILSVVPGATTVSGIMIEPLDAESFVLRAEGEMESAATKAIADLRYAIQLDPEHVRAHRLLLALISEQGRWEEALELAEAAVRLDPEDVWTRIKLAGVLLGTDRPEAARAVLEQLQTVPDLSPLVVGQVKRLLGRACLAGPAPDHQAAVEHFAEAIRRAAPLVAKKSPAMQAAATEVVLGAHLGTARAIAEGSWQQKGRVIPKWLGRSEGLVKDFKGSEPEKLILELQLCRGALATVAGSTEAGEALPWVKRLLELRDRMGKEMTDPWRRRQIDWEVGLGLKDALLAAERRGDATDMLDNATLTAAFLEHGSEYRDLTAGERREFGELMFRIGVMHSLQRGDHATAVTWFDRVVPLWETQDDVPAALPTDPGRLGESLVSMAISYWQVDRREDALALSQRGVDLMVAAVASRQLEERALAVAYGNLATMYAAEGDERQSRAYAEMASKAEAAGGTLR